MQDVNQQKDEKADIEPPPFQGSSADKEATRKRKALFLRQSLVIADRFSRNPVTYSMLSAAILWLEREQYDNIAVERNAHGLCGYVLCPNPLGDPISQVYRIHCSKRRVFDLTQRKHFCSDWCYSASKHVRNQIPSEPGWCRTQALEAKELTLLAQNARSYPGKLVLDGLRRLRVSCDDNEDLSDDASDTKESPSISDPSESDINSLSSNENSRSSSPISELLDEFDDDKRLLSKNSKAVEETTWGVRVEPPRRNLVVERDNICVQPEVLSPVPLATQNPTDLAVYNDLFCAIRMRMQRWISRKAFCILTDPELLPSVKVDDTGKSTETTNSHQTKAGSSGSPPPGVLPLIESVSVDTMRRHILMEELIPSMKAILSKMNIPTQSILSTLENAITYFKLTNRNVYMTRIERGLVSLALLRLMTPIYPCLAPFTDTDQLASVLETFTTRPVTDFLNVIIDPLYKHFDGT